MKEIDFAMLPAIPAAARSDRVRRVANGAQTGLPIGVEEAPVFEMVGTVARDALPWVR